ncbi:RNA polymerase, sigma subunit, ECF family [Syntrophobotulus glycolicus DSM 8271]|uniref:RNA polymerase, sigma subunit, ECF family n=1 Tax=Syntrophobotulus glycolicus (strain DSM 8271 / FlGlyR) TaxID=645991 RepID=F0T230_SYNGF|nr:RNA polymerase sigma factor [Syntrophobotulus glycolicus]ADY56374.1 RNA polymerase, sigma subunit, ECF family [Syntrophobotulus glycolicus DSM 8271]
MGKNEIDNLIEHAISGDKKDLEELLLSVQDIVFNLSLRMLGTLTDAEDATQDILVHIMTNLSSFRRESTFQTWVYRLSVNYLINYKKSMFSQYPMDFEFYGNDIRFAKTDEVEALTEEMSRELLSDELKMSCTNVMLQCLDSESRCIFIMGTMFKIDSRIAGEVLHITPENYRQRLSRTRKKVAGFLAYHCGLTETGFCLCQNRINYAISQGRVNPKKLEYTQLRPLDKSVLFQCKEEMEHLDALACSFEKLPCYQSTVTAYAIIEKLFHSKHLKKIQEF